MSGAAREHTGMGRALIALVAAIGLLGACNAPPAPAARNTAGGSAAPAAPAATTGSPPAPVKMKTAYTTAGASMASVWLADEDGGFAREGIDAEVSFIGAGQAILGALSSQEAPIVLAGGNQVIEANLQGGEYVMLGTASPYLTNSIYAHASIQRPDDLRGKSIGVSNFGAISHVAAKIALEHWGLQEGRDVTVVRSGGTPETLAAMQSGGIAAGSFSPPQSFRARDLGFHELIDISTLRYEFSSAAIISTRRYVAEHPDIVERYLKAMIRGSHAFKTNKDAAVDSIMRNARVDDRAVAEETWVYFVDKTSDDLVMSSRAVENNLRMLADEQPGAASARVDQFYDPSFVERIRASGFVDQVLRGQ